jgi:hypothetical protein
MWEMNSLFENEKQWLEKQKETMGVPKLNKIYYSHMKKIFLIICALQSGMLCAQQLYFLRATVTENYFLDHFHPYNLLRIVSKK